jgi:hypothetical protein
MTDENIPDVDWDKMEDSVSDGTLPPGYEHTVLSPEMLAKRLVRDVVPCDMAVAVADLLGLHRASEDVEDMEHVQSHMRLNDAGLIVPFLSLLAPHAAAAGAAALVVGAGATDDISPEDLRTSVERLTPMIYATSLSVIAELIDIGVLHTPHYATTTSATEDDLG